jgi:hypothetical protein
MRRVVAVDRAEAVDDEPHMGCRPRKSGPREFTVRTSIGRLVVAECGLCGALSVQDAGQLRHMALTLSGVSAAPPHEAASDGQTHGTASRFHHHAACKPRSAALYTQLRWMKIME